MRHVTVFLALLAALCARSVVAAVVVPPWILVDSANYTLTVYQGDEVLQTFRHVTFGRGGIARQRRMGDGKTPKGTFHVAWINPNSRYRLFFGLDYPSAYHVERAYQGRLIDTDTYVQLRVARAAHRLPPQDTPLGGFIGIHGLGSGDPEYNLRYNWTEGCVALTNEQIRQLAHWVRLGTMVVIR